MRHNPPALIFMATDPMLTLLHTLLCSGVLLLAVRAQSAPASRPAADPVAARVAALRAEHDLPALGGAWFTRERVVGVWVDGVRAEGLPEAVTAADQWHLGSCTKSMTAFLLALLVERGDLAWDRPLSQLLPALREAMHADYRDLTLVELLAHRAGLAANGPGDALARCARLPGTTADQRRAFVREVLAARPVHPPRTRELYSNAGFIVAGHIAECATSRSWETLMRELVFTPLGLTSAGFGPPGTPERRDQPRGHDARGRPLAPGPDADNPPLLGPAGTCHMALGDWARYLQVWLRGAVGDVTVGAVTVRQATFARLRTAYAGGTPGSGYGYGWGLAQRPWAGGDHLVLTHNGSNTLWFCVCWLDPAGGSGVLAACNRGGAAAERATDAVCALLLQQRDAERASRPAVER